jgi:hypothetical protein
VYSLRSHNYFVALPVFECILDHENGSN